jgi:hypothetical protein
MSTAGIQYPDHTVTASTSPPAPPLGLAAMLAMTPPILSSVAREVLRELQVARMSPTWQPARRDWNLAHLISRIGSLMTAMHLRRLPDAAASAARCLVLLRLIHAPKDSSEQDALWLKAREELGSMFNPSWPESVTMMATGLGAALEEPVLRRVCAVDHLAELLLATAKCWPKSPVPPPLFLTTREVA